MADEQEAIAPTALETASAPAAIETETAPADAIDEPTRVDDADMASLTDGEDITSEEVETTEIEWDDGKKYIIPKAIEGGILKNKDYTTKTQETAALKKALDAKEATIEERLKATDEELDARADLRQVTRMLDEFGKLSQEDWAAHEANDFVATQQAWRQYQMLKDQKAVLEGKISKAQTDRTGVAEQALATRIQETVEYAKKNIPGWKPDTIPELVKFASDMGVPEDAIKANWSPTFLNILHRAHLGDQLLKKQATAPKSPTTTVTAPLKTVNGKGSPATRGDLAAIDDMGAYIAARKQGVGGKASF